MAHAWRLFHAPSASAVFIKLTMQIRLAPALARAEDLAVPTRSQLRTKVEVRGGAFPAFKGISAALAAVTAASAIVADAMTFMILRSAINAPLTIE